MTEDGGWGWILMTIVGPFLLGLALIYGSMRWRNRAAPDKMQLGDGSGGINHPHPEAASKRADGSVEHH